MADAALGSLVVELSANLARFEQDMNRAAAVTQSSVGKIERLASGAAGALGAIGAGISFGAIVGSVRQVVSELDQLGDIGEAFDLTAENMGEIGYAAKIAGVDIGELERAFAQLASKSSAALGGDQGALALFEALGQSADDLRSKNFNSLTRDIFRVFTEFEGGANKVALAREVFGKGGTAIIELADKLGSLGGEAQRAGQVLAGDLVRQAGSVNDNLNRLAVASDLVKVSLVSNLLPGLERVSAEAISAANAGENLIGVLIRVARATFFGDELLIAQKQLFEATDRLLAIQNQIDRVGKGKDDVPWVKQLKASKAAVEDEIKSLQALIKLNEEGLNPKGQTTKRPAPVVATTQPQQVKKQLADTVRSVEDYEARLNQALAGAINESAIVKTRELQDVIAKLDQLFFDGKIGVDVYDSAMQKLTGTMTAAKPPADELAGILARTPDALQETATRLTALADNAFFDGSITERQRDQALALVNGYQTVATEAEKASNVAREIGLTFASAAEDALAKWEGFGKFFQGLEQDLIRFGTRRLLTEPLLGAADAVFGKGKASGQGFQGLVESGLGFLKGLIPSFDVGTPFVPKTGLALVHQGERIIPAAQNRAGAMGGINITINASGGMDRRSAQQLAAETGRAVARAQRRNG